MRNLLNMTVIQPWWLRLVVMLVIFIPALTGWPISFGVDLIDAFLIKFAEGYMEQYTHAGRAISEILVWVIYAALIWCVILSSAGSKRFMEYIAAAFIIGLTTAILGAAVRKIFPFIAGDVTPEEVSFKMVYILIIIVTVVPYTILFVNCFSAKSMIDRLSRSEGRFVTIGLHIALTIRIFQHAGEVITNLMEVWSEEHPQKLLPRHKRDWGNKWYKKGNFVPWFLDCIFSWVYATMMHTFEPLPSMVDEVERVNHYLSKKGESDV